MVDMIVVIESFGRIVLHFVHELPMVSVFVEVVGVDSRLLSTSRNRGWLNLYRLCGCLVLAFRLWSVSVVRSEGVYELVLRYDLDDFDHLRFDRSRHAFVS